MNLVFDVLLLDKHPSDGEKIQTFLEQNTKPSFRVLRLGSLKDALRFLKDKNTKIDIIIFDLFSGDDDIKEAYKLLSRSAGRIPILVITSKIDHSLACEIVSEGAAGIIVRERFKLLPDRLIDSIEFSIIRNKLVSELKEKSAEEAWEHKRILHWMTGGYSVESGTDPVVESVEGKKDR